MDSKPHISNIESQEHSSNRKQDHIELALQSQTPKSVQTRFYYEPMLSAHPTADESIKYSFLGKNLSAPIWVSSMTGGTALAKKINFNLAKVCGEFGLGMGLGSCRSLLYDQENFKDFDVRKSIGNDLPLYANLGIAQVEEIVIAKKTYILNELVDSLQADGLIIHVNPSQEWLQPEGDHFTVAPIETIQRVLDLAKFPIIVKEVGQGMGYHSLKELMQLPLAAIEFASHGGTNFSLLELMRNDKSKLQHFKPLIHIGHSAEEMVEICNTLKEELKEKVLCEQFIISGGIRSFLDGYYLMSKLQSNCIYGQAAPFLEYARKSYAELRSFVQHQVDGLNYAKAFLRIK